MPSTGKILKGCLILVTASLLWGLLDDEEYEEDVGGTHAIGFVGPPQEE
jgi:hypothetical protein